MKRRTDDSPLAIVAAVVLFAALACVVTAMPCALLWMLTAAKAAEPAATEAPAVTAPLEAAPNYLDRWGLPEGTVLVDVPGHLCGAYDGRSRCPRWKMEYLTPRFLHGDAERKDNFREDVRIPVEFRATLGDFRDAHGFDRGHTAPARDCGSQAACDATFLLSNMTPQVSELNEVLWRQLEDHVRSLVEANTEVWVCTLPIFASDDRFLRIQTVGPNHVWVPSGYAKSVLVLSAGQREPKRLRTWLVPNAVPELGAELEEFAATVDEVEQLAGLDLWAGLPAGLEAELEAAK